MPTPIGYSAIADQIKAAIEADSTMEGVRIYVEEEPQFGLMDQPVVAIFMKKRSAAPDRTHQRLAAATRIRMHITFSCWVVAFSIESYKIACDVRNEILANLELCFLRNTAAFSSSSEVSMIEGGVTPSARDPQSQVFIAAGEIELTISATGITI